MITIFEKFEKKPDLSVISPEFWQMTKVANWKEVVKGYKNNPKISDHKDFFIKAQERVYKRYDYKRIKQFEKECHDLYRQLYDYFKSTWLSDSYDFMPSDDGYWDLLSSIIGFGKKFVIKCINNKMEFVEVAEKDNYIENFSYLFQISEKEYNEIKELTHFLEI